MNPIIAISSLSLAFPLVPNALAAPEAMGAETRVIVESDGWELVGDLVLPESDVPVPAVLLLNKAAGDRTVYRELAEHLAARGVASLRLDLRGHGESVNLGRFEPGENADPSLIWDSEVDVVAAHRYLKTHAAIDPERVGFVGGSYSGEEMAEAGRVFEYGAAYVELSPGSFSDESIDAIDTSGVPWLFVAAKRERYLQEITALVQERSETVEMIIPPGTAHATRLLEAHPDLAERIAVWLAQRLR